MTEPKSIDRYQMCADQPAQIDCHIESCIFHKGLKGCTNISPAISLNIDGIYQCWSGEFEEEESGVESRIATCYAEDIVNSMTSLLINAMHVEVSYSNDLLVMEQAACLRMRGLIEKTLYHLRGRQGEGFEERNDFRVRHLPEKHREPFALWLRDKTMPTLEGILDEEQDGYYPWDYEDWLKRTL